MLNWKDLVLQMAVIGLGSNPKTAPLVQPIVSGIHHAESIPGAKGQAKFDAAVAEAKDVVHAINAAKPGTIDESELDSTLAMGTESVVTAANAFKHAGHVIPATANPTPA